ncbi:unnamed protein product [marine sediment metagenome]|uniref:Nmd3 N-terminal domain-containing protein n=1 Tax=marine sediment metagenome TaxID=412755 RepID=X0TJA0_9ZZZZ
MAGNYYTGILQLRNPNDDAVRLIRDLAEKRKDFLITKEAKVPGGIDFYVTDNSFLVALGKKVKVKFGGDMKISKKLFSKDRQTSRLVYRVNVLVRIPWYKRGDVIKIGSKEYKVKSLDKGVTIIDLKTQKKKHFSYRKLEEIKDKKIVR